MVSINQVSNHVHRGPTGGFEESLAQLGERHIVHREDLSDVALSAAPSNLNNCDVLHFAYSDQEHTA